jgi:ABC-type sugar transport system ATPase subunit
LLEAIDLRKKYGAITAVDGVSIDVGAGEVLGLVGENGAGKSTLIAMLGGTTEPDEGRIIVDGEVNPGLDPGTARRLRIAVVYQELSLCDNLSVADNVFLGQPVTRFGILDRRTMRARTRTMMAELGVSVRPDTDVDQLRLAEQQLTEIARALAGDVRLLILDEPTSSLGQDDFETLKSIVRKLQDRGVGVIFVSHRLSEVLDLSDRVAIMRDGRLVATREAATTSAEQLATLMVDPGKRGATAPPHAVPVDPGPNRVRGPVVELSHACLAGKFDDVSISIASGEIIGIAGLRGAGRHEVADAIVGLQRLSSGEVRVEGSAVRRMTPRTARQMGISYVPQDRRTQGLIGVWDLQRNLALGNLDRLLKWGTIRRGRAVRWSRDLLVRFRVTPRDPSASINSLSGGNQQKVVLARNLAEVPTLLVALEPTRGVDVGVKAEIREIIRRAAAKGAGVLLVDSELSDMLLLCDRIYVMHRGRVVGHLPRDRATEHLITLLGAGGSEVGDGENGVSLST